MTRSVLKRDEIREFIIANIEKHPKDIGRYVTESMNVSRVTATKHLQALVRDGLIGATGETKARIYALKVLKHKEFDYEVTPALEEDIVWSRDLKPTLDQLRENVIGLLGHGVTEMVNNVISHSRSDRMIVSITRTAAKVEITVTDFGIGIFQKIKEECGLSDLHHAVLELSKGKLTTDKEHHSGEGIFFTSRMVDEFGMLANGLFFGRMGQTNDWLMDISKQSSHGTNVRMAVYTNASQTAEEVFNKYRDEFDNFGFSKTIIPLTLMTYGEEQLISRSQAKRVMSRGDRFRHIVLDFKDVPSIGQAFADEIFRVYRKQNLGVKIHWVNANETIERMITHVLATEDDG